MRRSILVAVIVGSAAACAGGPTAAPTVPQVYDLNHDAASGIAAVDPHRGAVAPADQLRLILEQQMAWHGITLVEAMRSAEQGTSVATAAWIRQLSANTDDLVHSIGLAYGPVGARAFQQQWAQHTQFLVDYATAVGRHDGAAERQAEGELADYVRDQGSFFEVATGGRISARTARHVLSIHVHDMIEMVDAAARSDRMSSTRLALSDHSYLNAVADDLTGAIADQQPTAFPGPANTPTSVYCSAADQAADSSLIADLGGGSSSTSIRHVADSSPALHLLGTLGPAKLGSVDAASRALLDHVAASYLAAQRRHDGAAVAGAAHDVLDQVAKLASTTAPT